MVFMDAVKVEMGMGEIFGEWRLLDILHADDLILCSESQKDLKVMRTFF